CTVTIVDLDVPTHGAQPRQAQGAPREAGGDPKVSQDDVVLGERLDVRTSKLPKCTRARASGWQSYSVDSTSAASSFPSPSRSTPTRNRRPPLAQLSPGGSSETTRSGLMSSKVRPSPLTPLHT